MNNINLELMRFNQSHFFIRLNLNLQSTKFLLSTTYSMKNKNYLQLWLKKSAVVKLFIAIVLHNNIELKNIQHINTFSLIRTNTHTSLGHTLIYKFTHLSSLIVLDWCRWLWKWTARIKVIIFIDFRSWVKLKNSQLYSWN